MTTLVFTGDTITVKGRFTSEVEEGAPTSTLLDPDGNSVTITVYDADEVVITTATTPTDVTRESTGVYVYQWTAPLVAGIYWIEFKGLVATKPQLRRRKFSVKFKGDTV
jgi:hypothetical protein